MPDNNLFIDETEEVISLEEIRNHFENEMEDWERAEYDNCFNQYIVCCMWWNGGTLTPYVQG